MLIYENPLVCGDDVKDFILEGKADISFPNNRLRLEAETNFLFWCPKDFPSNIRIKFDFYPIEEPGLCMLFFSAMGRNGEDLFDSELIKRSGDYKEYYRGDINAFHLSYFRRRWEDERAFHTCNLRKSHGFHMVAQGGDPIPSVCDAKPPYFICLEKQENKIKFFINDLDILTFDDDGSTYGGLLGGGKVGFRQMAPMVAEYSNLKIEAI